MPTSDYRLKDGTPVPGVTTVLKQLGGGKAEALLQWANREGLKGNKILEVRDTATSLGTAVHEAITGRILGSMAEDFDAAAYDEHVTVPRSLYRSWCNWWDEEPRTPLFCERAIIHERLGYGGTPDCVYRDSTGRVMLADWKTTGSSKPRVYHEHVIQLAGYMGLLAETGTQIHGGQVVVLSEHNDPEVREFTAATLGDVPASMFMAALMLYTAERRMAQVMKEAGR